jgi:hypothetical protein
MAHFIHDRLRLSPSDHVLLLGKRFLRVPKGALAVLSSLTVGSALLVPRSRSRVLRGATTALFILFAGLSSVVASARLTPAQQKLDDWRPVIRIGGETGLPRHDRGDSTPDGTTTT